MAALTDGPTGTAAAFAEGAPCWADAMVADLAAAKRFYGGLFGWTFEDAAPGPGSYAAARAGERRVAGLMQKTDGRMPTVWTVYLATPDAEATAGRVRAAGGQVITEPRAVGTGPAGVMAVAADPGGAVFGLWQPGAHRGFEALGEPGAYRWVDLFTRHPRAVDAFYPEVFGYRALSQPGEPGDSGGPDAPPRPGAPGGPGDPGERTVPGAGPSSTGSADTGSAPSGATDPSPPGTDPARAGGDERASGGSARSGSVPGRAGSGGTAPERTGPGGAPAGGADSAETVPGRDPVDEERSGGERSGEAASGEVPPGAGSAGDVAPDRTAPGGPDPRPETPGEAAPGEAVPRAPEAGEAAPGEAGRETAGGPGAPRAAGVRDASGTAGAAGAAGADGAGTGEAGTEAGVTERVVWVPGGEPADEEHAVVARRLVPPGTPEALPAHFLPYFAVADCDATAATARRLGGRVTRGPETGPYGRWAVLADDQGAAFAVLGTGAAGAPPAEPERSAPHGVEH
ncbi:VOC family protein [Streptomyces sp. TRM70308]|uniref:VOC family protein n=1 Tax=Streptomyces sp. TRM70308 TaxID=3131932 RepID=UPI003D06F93C